MCVLSLSWELMLLTNGTQHATIICAHLFKDLRTCSGRKKFCCVTVIDISVFFCFMSHFMVFCYHHRLGKVMEDLADADAWILHCSSSSSRGVELSVVNWIFE